MRFFPPNFPLMAAAGGGGRGGVDEIGDEDVFVRYVSPGDKNAIGEDNRPKSAAFPKSQLKKGWSGDLARLLVFGADRAALARSAAKEKPYGHSSARAGDIRAVLDAEGRAAFVVVAAPVKGNDAHALILAAREYDKQTIQSLRGRLIDKFGEVVVPQ